MNQVVRYLDARHYEVFKMEDLMRDIEYEQQKRPQASFNGSYEFFVQSQVRGIQRRRQAQKMSALFQLCSPMRARHSTSSFAGSNTRNCSIGQEEGSLAGVEFLGR